LSKDLLNIYQKLNVKKNENFPINNSLVLQATQAHEKFFTNYIKEYGYYDIFIISKDNGHIMYANLKKSDYGKNLNYSQLKESGLGEVYQKVKERKKVVFVDMKPYFPSNNEPSMFVGKPIYINNEFKSIIVFQISNEKINKIMNFRKGYGYSQEDYLVGKDFLMRSDSFLDPKKHSLIASFKNPSTGKANTVASRDALNGNTNTKIIIKYNGNPVLSSYSPFIIGNNDVNWAIISEFSMDVVPTKTGCSRLTQSSISLTTARYFSSFER